MTSRRFWWWLWYAAMVAALMNQLPDLIHWLDSLPSGQQALVTGGILVAVPAIAGGAVWLVRTAGAVALGWRRRAVEAAEAERLRLMPQPRVGIIDARNAEVVAGGRVSAAVENIRLVEAEFRSQSQAVVGRLNGLTKSAPDAVVSRTMADMARCIDRYAANLSQHTKDFKAAVQMLSDAWSSRLYWHDKRGSASRMMDREFVQTVRQHLKLARGCKETWGRSGVVVEERLIGLTSKMDKASDKYKTQLARLMSALTEQETNCERVLEFYRQRSGIKGVIRRIGRGLGRR